MGELLKSMARSELSKGGDLKSAGRALPPDSEFASAKSAAGISDDQAKDYQRLASVPERDYEAAVRDPAQLMTTSASTMVDTRGGLARPAAP